MKIKEYFIPKSMIYTGAHTNVQTKIIHYQFTSVSLTVTDSFEPNPLMKHYIQVIGLSEIEKIQSIKSYFKVDPLVLEDVFNVKQRNKLELRDESLFCAFHIEYLDKREIKNDYLSILLYEDTIISFHETEPLYLLPIKTLIETSQDTKAKEIDYLFFQILDIITDHHLDVFEYLEYESSRFEEKILETKNVDQEMFYLIRKQMLKLKNNVYPVLEQFDKIFNKRHLLFRDENAGYYEDLKDHLKRLDDHLNQSRELMRHLLDLHINNQSNKMNRIMTTLTLFSAIFIPLSFLTGFFGMNFVNFGILQYENAVGIFGLICLAIAGFMFFLFKKVKWF